jgi:glycosyltransferase involved in cell wall biosynthesis
VTERPLYILRYYPTLTETFVYRELDELARRGHRPLVAALGARPDGALQDQPPQVRVWRAPRGPRTWASWPRLSARHLGWKASFRVGALLRAARAWGVTRVHAHFVGEGAAWGAVVAEALGVPLSITPHAVDLFKPRSDCGGLLAKAERVIAITEFHRRWLREHYGVEAPVVRCGVHVPRGSSVAVRAGAEPLRLISVGRDVPKKGMAALAAVCAELPEVSARLVTDAPRLAGPRCEVGPLPPGQVPAALARAHVFALALRQATDGDMDGMPIAILEAMAAGLPVIAGDVAGVAEVVDAEVGWLVPAGDDPALRSALLEALADPTRCAEKGAAGRARLLARGLTVEAQVDGLLQAWGAR